MKRKNDIRILITGGGTGGHVFPAIAIADALKTRLGNVEFLFVGARDRLEMEKVPQAGYRIIGLPVMGFIRKISFRNVRVLFRLIVSLRLSRKIIARFKPDVVVGVGGYASGPVLSVATRKGIPTLIQEQNSYAGITNRILARKVNRICVAYDDMERYFPINKLVMTGNPVRTEIQMLASRDKNKEALEYFGLDKKRKVILILGGSLGARTINHSIMARLDLLLQEEIQLLWQCGKGYYGTLSGFLQTAGTSGILLLDFISRMDLAYAAADLIISRAGAITVSELCHVGKPVILVPSPNVVEDHQTKNALALVRKNAAVHISDPEAEDKMIPCALDILKDAEKANELAANIRTLAVMDSAGKIADEIIGLIQ
jgi:UDP-N-acetylglucosamine--N-acetylmuramyl-(pentapeptide) pyrophosphoryl-undecaprenol N-acetylglucosamine transferase